MIHFWRSALQMGGPRWQWWDRSQPGLHGETPFGGGLFQGVIVPLVLVHIALGESHDGVVEALPRAQIGGNGDPAPSNYLWARASVQPAESRA